MNVGSVKSDNKAQTYVFKDLDLILLLINVSTY
jgi:hypothetical protein